MLARLPDDRSQIALRHRHLPPEPFLVATSVRPDSDMSGRRPHKSGAARGQLLLRQRSLIDVRQWPGLKWVGLGRQHPAVNAFAAATAVAVLVVTGAGCSIHADKTQTRSTPTSATTPTSRSAEPAGPATAYSVHCIHVPANISRRIASRVGEGAGMAPGLAEAVRSPDLENVYVVAMQFKVTGVTQTQLGFWAVRPSVQVDQHRRVMSV